VWVALFVATLAVIGMITMGKFMKEMHVEYLRQQVESVKEIVSLKAEFRELSNLIRGRPCIAEDKHRR